MASIRCMVEQVGIRLLVHMSGELSMASAPRVRAELMRALVRQPDAVVVDLADLVVREPTAVSVFAAVARQAAMWPGTPLLVCTEDDEAVPLLTQDGYGRLPVFASVEQALSAPAPRRMNLVCDTLLPVTSSAGHARQLATEVCDRWELPHLAGPACLIASELAINAAVHAGTLADIRFAVGRRYLMISVRDGSTAEPRLGWAPPTDPGAGRGLLMVDATAYRWGCLPIEGGKVVWASLRTREAPTP
ncbi:ATP-binding protein [Krasilnikovia cinnamomea]|nr:ATP-binding protein [Krasilnikovia cinnamomea]